MTLDTVLDKWPELKLISENRLRAIKLMLECGWKLDQVMKKSQRHYTFRRPDTGGLYDVMEVSHAQLDPLTVALRLVSYETDLADAVHSVAREWTEKKIGLA